MSEDSQKTINVHIERSCNGVKLGDWSFIVFVDCMDVLTVSRSDAVKLYKALEQALEETEEAK